MEERGQMEDPIRKSGEIFRKFFESANDCMAYLDRSGRILDVNRKALKVFGGSKEELLGKHFTKIGVFSPRDIPRALSAFAGLLAGGKPVVNVSIKNKKGREMHIEVSGSLMKIDGKTVGMMVIARDVTERKIMGERIAYLASIVDNAKVAIATVDMNGVVTYCNKTTEEMLGWTSKEVIGKPMARLCPNAGKQIEATMKEGFCLDKELDYVKKDGNSILCSTSTFLMKDNDGKPMGIGGIAIDITERKKMEEELMCLSSAVKMSTDSIVISDLDAKIIDVNEATLKMYGTDDKGDLIGKNSFDFIAPEDLERALAGMKEVLEKGYVKGREYHIIIKDGSRIPVEMNTAIMKDADGKPIGFVGISRDITQRRREEEALRESEEKFRDIFDGVNDEILYVDKYGKIVDVNNRVEDIFGYKRDEVIGKNFARLGVLQPKDSPIMLKQFMDAMRGGVVYPLMEYEIKDKKGNKVPVEASTRLIRKDGKTEGLLVIVRDIRERKKMEEKLRQYSEHLEELVQKRTEELLESEKRYSVLVEEARDGVGIIQDGKLVFVNKMASEIYGYSRDELIGLSFLELVDEKYHPLVMERYMQRLRGEKVPQTYEIEVIAKNGERVPVELSATHMNFQGRPADLVIARDVRERKRMEEERLKLEKLATIGELATMVGHDLRNPLQAIENAAYYLNNELPRLLPSILISQKAVEMLQVINHSVNYADKIIRDLHDFSATKKLTLKKTNINTIVKDTLSQIETPENVELTTELANLPKIKADKDMIKRAFLNLATNAIQAMENGGTLKISTKKTDGMIEVSFKDTGIGISKQNMKKIFTPFFTTRAKGMGMGLAICKKFVEMHGGSIHAESEEGKGSTFTVKLPIQQDNGG